MSNVRVAFIALCGFVLPVLLGVYAAPLLFSGPHSGSSDAEFAADTAESALPQHPDSDSALGSLAAEQVKPAGSSAPSAVTYQSFAADRAFDPSAGAPFIVSVAFQLEELPTKRKRRKLIYKYDADKAPYQGWALALHRLTTSLRPELYWQGADGKGGWYSFEELKLTPGKRYAVTLYAAPGRSISLFIEELRGEGGGGGAERGEKDPVSRGAVFLGGFELPADQLPATESELFVMSAAATAGGLHADMGPVLIASPAEMPFDAPAGREQLAELFRGGPDKLASRLDADQIALWIDESKTDRSRHARVSTGLRSG